MKRNHKKEIKILKHKKAIIEIDLVKVNRARDECKRQMDKWRQAAQKLGAVVLKQKRIPLEAKRIIKDFQNH